MNTDHKGALNSFCCEKCGELWIDLYLKSDKMQNKPESFARNPKELSKLIPCMSDEESIIKKIIE